MITRARRTLVALATVIVVVAGSCSTGDGTATPSTAAPPSPGCRASDSTQEERIASVVFAALEEGSLEELEGTLASGAGGIVVSTAAASLVAGGALVRLAEAPLPPLVAVDEEGGRVQRLRSVLGPLPSARVMAATMAPPEIRETARRHGEAMRAVGITVDFAPVADVSTEPDGGPIGDRSFSNDPETVIAAAGAFAAGLRDAGVLPTLKHFPGHGRASGDSHDGLVTTPPIDEMEGDLVPFRALVEEGEVAVMTGHLAVPGLTGGEAASLSPAATEGLLRGELGFDGLVITDDLGAMGSIRDRYSVAEAAVLSIVAGADMVLLPTSAMPATTEALAAAVADGRLSEDRLAGAADRVSSARGCSGAR